MTFYKLYIVCSATEKRIFINWK